MKELIPLIIFTGIIIILCAIAFFKEGKDEGIRITREKAIEANVAEWTVDPKTGETEFVFKECDGISVPAGVNLSTGPTRGEE